MHASPQCDRKLREPGRLPSRRSLPIVVTLVGVVLSGCAGQTLTSGATLAKAGQSAATQMEQNITLSGSSLTSLRQAVAFNDGFNNQVGNADSAAFLANIATIQANLGQYSKLLKSLSAAYAALGDLASYDATGSFNIAIGNLATDSGKFASAVGRPITVPSDVTSGVKQVGAFFIGYFQADEVKDASAKIETLLKQIIPILDDPATRTKLIPVQTEVTGQINQAAATLFDQGIYSYDPLLDSLGAPLGMKSTAASDAAVAQNKRVQAGLRNVANEFASAQTASAASYDKSLAALKALVPLHESLQNGAPLNLDTLSRIVSQLRTLAISLQPASTKGK
jgi:hypothetical protein